MNEKKELLKMERNQPSNLFPSPESRIDNVIWPHPYNKLIVRLENCHIAYPDIVDINEYVSSILELTEENLLKAPGIGSKYIALWKKLKEEYESGNIQPAEKYVDHEARDKVLENTKFNYKNLTALEIKCLEKLVLQGFHVLPNVILNLNVKEIRAVGKQFFSSLNSLKKKIVDSFEAYENNSENYFQDQSVLKFKNKNINIDILDECILNDIDVFLESMSESSQDIFQHRWGFVEEKETLETIAQRQGLTRERIRQKEAKDNELLINFLRFQSEDIRNAILSEADFLLADKMPYLSSCFDDKNNFINFLSFISGFDGLHELINPTVPDDILTPYFMIHGRRLSIEFVTSCIQSFLEASIGEAVAVNNIIKMYESKNIIFINGDHVLPRMLTKKQAAACVLAEHPNGLPWLDLAKIINYSGISNTLFSEVRRENTILDITEYIYLSGKGVYKHVNFLNADDVILRNIAFIVYNTLIISSRSAYNLIELYSDDESLRIYDYYIVRHAIRKFGNEFGIYFNGKSQADTVSLGKKSESVSQETVIIEAMIRKEVPITKAEIAGLIKSKSLGHASFYLESMLSSGKAVQIDRMLYTVPEVAFKDIDLSLYECEMQKIMNKDTRPIDPSWFQYCLNKYFSDFRSRQFYNAIARYLSISNSWNRAHSLYSILEIQFSNLNAACDLLCDEKLGRQENADKIRAEIAITKDYALTAVDRWRVIRG